MSKSFRSLRRPAQAADQGLLTDRRCYLPVMNEVQMVEPSMVESMETTLPDPVLSRLIAGPCAV